MNKLTEMATLRKERSKLPVNIYIDDAGTYLNSGHFKRIKFQKDYGQKPLTRSFATMTLDGIVIESTMKENKVSKQDIEMIRNFVLNNRECLSEIADFNLDFTDFLNYLMIPGGKVANEEEKEVQKKLLKNFLI